MKREREREERKGRPSSCCIMHQTAPHSLFLVTTGLLCEFKYKRRPCLFRKGCTGTQSSESALRGSNAAVLEKRDAVLNHTMRN